MCWIGLNTVSSEQRIFFTGDVLSHKFFNCKRANARGVLFHLLRVVQKSLFRTMDAFAVCRHETGISGVRFERPTAELSIDIKLRMDLPKQDLFWISYDGHFANEPNLLEIALTNSSLTLVNASGSMVSKLALFAP